MNFERHKEVKESMVIGKVANPWLVESVYEYIDDSCNKRNITHLFEIIFDLLDGMLKDKFIKGKSIRRRDDLLFCLRNPITNEREDFKTNELWGKWISYNGDIWKLPVNEL